MSYVNMQKNKSLFEQESSNKKKSFNYDIKELMGEVDMIEIMESEYDVFFEETSNGWYNTHCPLPGHDDSSPSFGVNPDKGTFNCFGCGQSGDLISFIQKMEGITFRQALERFLSITGLSVDNEAGDVYRTLRNMNSVVDEFVNFKVEYNLPGGIAPIEFVKSVNKRIKNFELKLNEEQIEKLEIVYEKLDTLIMKEDYKSLNKMWKTLTNELKDLCND